MALESKHQLISRTLLKEIAAGEYQPSGRLPSETQLVKRFRVSRPTVARAMRDLQDQGLVERRAGSGTFLRRGNVATVGQRDLGLLVPELGTVDVLQAICGDLTRLARLHNFNLLSGEHDSIEAVDFGFQVAEALCADYIKKGVRGVFFAPFESSTHSSDWNRKLAAQLRDAGISVILLDRDLGKFPVRSEFDLVGIDNFAGGFVMTNHLLRLGCKQLVFLAPRTEVPTVRSRISGAYEAVRAAGISASDAFVQRVDPEDVDAVQQMVAETGCRGVLCANDRLAVNLMQTLKSLGIGVPADIRIVGFDDVEFAASNAIPLTTIHQPCRDLAAVAFRAMVDSIEERDITPRSYVLPIKLIVRESCGVYREQ